MKKLKVVTKPVTVQISDYISACGELVRRLPGGKAVIRTNGREVTGREVTPA